METFLTRSPAEAAEIIKRGGLVAFPTETVYGLGADIFNEKALQNIFRAKQRPADNPLIAHIFEPGQIELLARELTDAARVLIENFFPGPLTVVCRKTELVSTLATAELDTIGIRMPFHSLAREFLKYCTTPVAAPSANLSGRPSPTTWRAVEEDLSGRIDCILQGDATEIGLESTVVDCSGNVPVILRPGSVSFEQIKVIVPEIRAFDSEPETLRKSPGTRHKHYSPRARVSIVNEISVAPRENSAFIGLSKPDGNFKILKICRSIEEYSRELFEFFRECDRGNIEQIYCQGVEEKGIGTALMDRVRRAAEN